MQRSEHRDTQAGFTRHRNTHGQRQGWLGSPHAGNPSRRAGVRQGLHCGHWKSQEALAPGPSSSGWRWTEGPFGGSQVPGDSGVWRQGWGTDILLHQEGGDSANGVRAPGRDPCLRGRPPGDPASHNFALMTFQKILPLPPELSAGRRAGSGRGVPEAATRTFRAPWKVPASHVASSASWASKPRGAP